MPEKAAAPTPEAPSADVLRDVLELAALERPKWGPGLRALREEGALLNAGPDEEDEPSGTPAADPNAGNGDGNPAEPDGNGSPSEPSDIDWEKRYNDQRSEFDRRGSVIADIEGRNGPEKQAEALRQYGVDLDDEEDDDEPLGEYDEEFDDELRDPLEEIDEVRSTLQEREEAEKEAQLAAAERDYIEEAVEELEGPERFNIELSDEEYELVVHHALANRDAHDGRPDLEGGFKALQAAQEAARTRFAKARDDVPIPPIGAEGEPKVDMKDKEARQKLGRQVFEAHQRSASE